MLRINNNIAAMNIQRSIGRNVVGVHRQLERLSSGLRVNRAADDASGLVVSEGLRSLAARLEQDVRNAQQSADMLQVAEGSLQEVNNILVRMKELSIQSATSTLNDRNRDSVAAEFNQLVAEIDRIGQATIYNEQSLLTGFGNRVDASSTAITTSNATGVTRIAISAAAAGTYTFVDNGADGSLTLGNGLVTQTLNTGIQLDGAVVASGTTTIANFDRLGVQVSLAGANTPGATGSYTDGDLNGMSLIVEQQTGGVFQIGPTANVNDRLEVGISDMTASGTTLNLGQLSVNNISGARSAMVSIDLAIETVASERGKIGAVQNRLAFSIGFTENEIENTTAADASIRDADVAREVTDFTRSQLLLSAGNAMLVQANVTSVQALSLL